MEKIKKNKEKSEPEGLHKFAVIELDCTSLDCAVLNVYHEYRDALEFTKLKVEQETSVDKDWTKSQLEDVDCFTVYKIYRLSSKVPSKKFLIRNYIDYDK